MGFRLEEGESADNSGRAWFLDLTQMLGSDVPVSVEDPRIPAIIEYANAHPGYDAGTLLHAAVTQIDSKRKIVVWNQQGAEVTRANYDASLNVTEVSFSDGVCTYTATAKDGLQYRIQADAIIQGHKYYRRSFVKADAGASLKVDADASLGSVSLIATGGWDEVQKIYTSTSTVVPYTVYGVADRRESDWTPISYKNVIRIDLTQMFGYGSEPTDTSDPRISAIIAYAEAHPEYNAGQTLGLTYVDGVLTIVPDITAATLEIPAAVRALEGYGQSAFGGDGNTLDLADGTYTEIGHYVDGVWTLLDTPSVTDVSSLLPNNMLTTEAGGTLTFVSEAGLAVPNSVDYLIKLSEVTP